MGQPRLEELTIPRIGDQLGETLGELVGGRGGVVVLCHAETLPHHLRQRPESHTLAVVHAASRMPVRDVDQAVYVAVELGAESGLAAPSRPHHRHQAGRAPLGSGVEQLLDQAELGVPTDEAGFQAIQSVQTCCSSHHALHAPEVFALGLALQLEGAGVGVSDRRTCCLESDVIDQHLSGLCRRLHPGGGVDPVADHEHVGIVHRRRPPRHHPGTGRQALLADPLPVACHRIDQFQCGTYRSGRRRPLVPARFPRPPPRRRR